MAEDTITSPQADQQAKRDSAEPAGVEPAVSQAEQSVRAQHQTEGGGAWPPELLAERAVTPGEPIDVAALYEQQAAEAKKKK